MMERVLKISMYDHPSTGDDVYSVGQGLDSMGVYATSREVMDGLPKLVGAAVAGAYGRSRPARAGCGLTKLVFTAAKILIFFESSAEREE